LNTKPITKRDTRIPLISFGKILNEEAEAGISVPGFRSHSEDRKERWIFWRRAAAVQAVYDQAPAGAEAIAAAVWRKLRSFRPKLAAGGLEELVSIHFRTDVRPLIYRKTAMIRELEINEFQVADDARRAARRAKAKKTVPARVRVRRAA